MELRGGNLVHVSATGLAGDLLAPGRALMQPKPLAASCEPQELATYLHAVVAETPVQLHYGWSSSSGVIKRLPRTRVGCVSVGIS